MKSLDNIAEDLFNKIRGRFPSVTIGDQDGKITNDPLVARFFDFDYKEGDRNVGKVSISVSEDKLAVMYSNSFVENEDTVTRQNWYNFLKELRVFAKKRLLQFDTRDITKSNLDKRDYKFLAQQGGEKTMSESKMYGTSKMSYQNIGNARLSIKHTESVNQEIATGRTQKIGAIYVENSDGERFKYPFKHLNGARAMARHVAEGGKPYDDFGKHITGLSEELANLRKFKSYMNRSSVMAESLAEYVSVVAERLDTIKKTVASLQKESYYKEAVGSYEVPVMEDVPSDVAENWIEQLTIKQFNEDLKDVFPYVYKLVSEASKAEELGPDELMSEEDDDPCWKNYKMVGTKKKNGKEVPNCVPEEIELESAFEEMMGQFAEGDDEVEQEPQTPLSEFILSFFDRETGAFPKGETGVLTKVEKEYGEQYIDPAKQFIEQINNKMAEMYGFKDPELQEEPISELGAGGPISMAIANTEWGEKVAQFFGDVATAKYGVVNLLRMAQQKYGPAIYDKMGLSDEAQAEIQAKLKAQGEKYEQNDLDNLITTGVKGSYEFIEKTIKDFEELIRNNPDHPKVPQVKAELAKLKPQLAQARKDSGMGETTMDEDLSQNYASDAEAIQALMAKGARSNEETQYLTMLARKYDFYGKPENIPAAIEKAKKAAAKQPGGVDGQGAKLSRDGGAGSTKPYTPKDFPSMAAAMAKVDYYEPGGRITIDGKPYVRDVDEKGKKFFRPDTRKPAPAKSAPAQPAPAKPAPAQGQPSSRLDTKGQTPSAESVELDRIKGLAGL